MIFSGKKMQSERGSIMLEVIAVLALMGVMGAMLFRQIYLRNQELHNVQMASEMRTVKEAFSAALQSRAQEVLSNCTIPSSAGEVEPCDVDYSSGSTNFPVFIKQYLPDGWFASSAGGDSSATVLLEYYKFYIFIYKQEDSSQKVKIYGLVFPKQETLPATGWNFKRAARVALLIGADGGVYGSGVTNDDIQGSLGTWSLDKIDDEEFQDPTYVAITGLDVFTPEYDVPEVNLKFPENWDVQVQKLNAYKSFTVGNSVSGCVGTIKHTATTPDANGNYEVQNDIMVDVGSSCLPTFWVDSGTDDKGGKVYVRNDLNVGMTSATATPAIRLTKEGAIIFSETVKDKQDENTKAYLLDPAYTSIMNDVKLMSRGGAKLSDILPNYILKDMGEEQLTLSGSNYFLDIAMPTCPAGYKRALMLIPQHATQTKGTMEKPITTITNTSDTPNQNVTQLVTDATLSGSTIDVERKNISISTTAPTIKVGADSSTQVVTDVALPIIKVSIGTDSSCGTYGEHYHQDEETRADTNTKFCVKSDKSVTLSYQTFCVFDVESAYTTEDDCKAAGYEWTTKCTPERIDIKRTDKTMAKSEAECYALGGSWNGTDNTCT